MIEAEKYSPALREYLMGLETSIRTECALPGGGAVVTMGFPGLSFDHEGQSVIEPERMEATLLHPALRACASLVVLLEEEELPAGAMSLLRQQAEARNMRLWHLPIPDYHAPDAAWEQAWQALAGEVAARFDRGQNLGLSCHYGAGRSGMIAAAVLIDHGASVKEAVAALRTQFPDTIESEAQMDWLHRHAAQRGSPI